MIRKQADTQKQIKKEFEFIEKKNKLQRESFRSQHLALREHLNSQSNRVTNRLERFNPQNK